MLGEPIISELGGDPGGKVHRINANSFQQNAITTINGWQYAVFYTEENKDAENNVSHVNLARRSAKPSGGKEGATWDKLTFKDYEQTADDGHNTISVGVCKGDGTIHLSFDHHCDKYELPCVFGRVY